MSACALHMEFMVQTEVHHLARLNVRSRGGGKKLEVDSEITRHLIPEIFKAKFRGWDPTGQGYSWRLC